MPASLSVSEDRRECRRWRGRHRVETAEFGLNNRNKCVYKFSHGRDNGKVMATSAAAVIS
jgi:hypothetical protein